jgi:membrane associated rhomboid family serine protease
MQYNQVSPVPPLTPVTKNIIIACVAAYFVDFLLTNLGFRIGGLTITDIFGLVPAAIVQKGWIWQFFTYLFLHGLGNPFHLLLNMLILWFFGAEIEMRLGARGYLFYYFLCGVGAGLFNFFVNLLFTDPARLFNPIIGASGAIYGVLAAYGIFFGTRYFLVFFLFPMQARYFVLIIAAVELIMGVQAGAQDNIAHFAHLGGMIVGSAYLYFKFMRPGGKGGSSNAERERLKRQFTLIVNESEKKDKKGEGPFWN